MLGNVELFEKVQEVELIISSHHVAEQSKIILYVRCKFSIKKEQPKDKEPASYTETE